MKPLITLFFLPLCNLPTFKLPDFVHRTPTGALPLDLTEGLPDFLALPSPREPLRCKILGMPMCVTLCIVLAESMVGCVSVKFSE